MRKSKEPKSTNQTLKKRKEWIAPLLHQMKTNKTEEGLASGSDGSSES